MVRTLVLSLPRVQVQFLVRELRSCKMRSQKKQKQKQNKRKQNYLYSIYIILGVISNLEIF